MNKQLLSAGVGGVLYSAFLFEKAFLSPPKKRTSKYRGSGCGTLTSAVIEALGRCRYSSVGTSDGTSWRLGGCPLVAGCLH